MRKLIAFDDETWTALKVLGQDRMATIQELADEAFADLLEKHHRPVSLRKALQASVKAASKKNKTGEAQSKTIVPLGAKRKSRKT